MKILLSAAVAATAVLAGTTGASATSLTFDFFYGGSDTPATDPYWSDEKVFTDAGTGIVLTVSGAEASDGHVLDFSQNTQVALWSGYGLGVKSSTDSGSTSGSHQVDAWGANDVGIFTLTNTDGYVIELTQIRFSYVDSYDMFDLYLEELDPDFYEGSYVVDDGVGSTFYSTYNFGTPIETLAFGIGAAQYLDCPEYQVLSYSEEPNCSTVWSKFKIKSVTFEVSPVPVPAAGGLLLLGLGGLAVMRRKSRA